MAGASAANIRAGGAFVEIFAQDGKFQQAMTRIQNRLRQTGKNMQQFGTGLSLGAGAVGAPMALAMRQFAGLDDAVRATAAAAGKGEGDLAGMRTAAEQMGMKFGTAAVDVAKLGIEIARAFGDKLSTDQLNSVTESVLALSKASGTDGVQAASIMTATLAQFGMGADQAARVADVLTHAANATLNSVESLGEALSYGGVNAAEMGMSLEETVAILGTLGNIGIQGSMAGTTLRRLSTVTAAEAQKLQEIFGVAFQDAAHNARPLVDVLGEVYQATAGLPSAERAKKFSDAFGLLGITGARSIGRMSADTRKLTADLQNATGTATKQAQFMEAGIGGAGRKLLEGMRSIGNAFGEAIAPAVMTVANAMTTLAGGIRQVVKDFPILSQIAAGAVAGLFAIGVASIAGGFALQTLASGLGLATKALVALATPAGLVTAAVVGGVALMLTAAYQLSPAFRQEADAIMAALSRLDFAAAWEVMNLNLAIALTQMAQAFSNAWAAVSNTAAATGAFIGDKLAEGVDRFMSLFGADILTLQAGLEKLGLYFRSAFDFSWATGELQRQLDAVDARIARERAKADTPDKRADARAASRQSAADQRQAANDARNAGYEATIDTLRDDLRRARDRALGKKPAETPAEAKPVEVEVSRPVAVTATPGEPAPEAAGGGGGNTLGTFAADLGTRLAAGPTANAAQQTAANTKRTADGVEQLLRADNGVGNTDGLGNPDGVGNVMGVGNESGVLGSGPSAAAPAPPAITGRGSALDNLPALTEQELTRSFGRAGFSDPDIQATSGPVDLGALYGNAAAAAVAPDPGLINRAASAAMPSAAQAPVAGDKELLSVAERTASLTQQVVDNLRKLVQHAERGGLAFS